MTVSVETPTLSFGEFFLINATDVDSSDFFVDF